MRDSKIRLVVPAILLWTWPLLCQGIIKRQAEVIWRGPEIIFVPRVTNSFGHPAEIQTIDGGVKKLPSLPRQGSIGKELGRSYSMGVQVAGGRIHYLHADILERPGGEPGKAERQLRISVFGFNEQGWYWDKEPRASLVWPRGMAPFLLQEDLILGVATSSKSFEIDGKSHLFMLFKKGDDSAFRTHSCPSTGLERPVFRPDGTWHYPALANLWISAKSARTAQRFVLASGAGTCWIFDVEKGSLSSLVQLYRSVSEEKMAAGEVWNGALLGIQPKSDGDFLVSALDEYALNQGYLMDQHAGRPIYGSPSERHAKLQETLDAILRMNPRVDWYVIDRESKQFLPEVPPKGLPRLIHGAAELQAFNWVIKPDGNLAFFGDVNGPQEAVIPPSKTKGKPGPVGPKRPGSGSK